MIQISPLYGRQASSLLGLALVLATTLPAAASQAFSRVDSYTVVLDTVPRADLFYAPALLRSSGAFRTKTT